MPAAVLPEQDEVARLRDLLRRRDEEIEDLRVCASSQASRLPRLVV